MALANRIAFARVGQCIALMAAPCSQSPVVGTSQAFQSDKAAAMPDNLLGMVLVQFQVTSCE